jgi:hypothetical protein
MQKRFIKASVLFFIVVFVSGCYSLNIYLTKPVIQSKGNKALTIATLDQRPYILKKESKPEYVATVRGGYGNPFDVLTDSGKPLSSDISGIVANSLKNNGYSFQVINTIPSDKKDETLNNMKQHASERYILIHIKELRGDSMYVTNYFSNIDIEVYDKNMMVIAKNNQQSSGSLGAVFSFSGFQEVILGSIKKDIESLLNNPGVINALK